MKTYLKIIALLCFICLMLTASAQCPSGDVVLLSQEEVNEFGTLYPNCTEIEGSLHVGQAPGPGSLTNINNLDAFNGITYIGGDLTVGQNLPSMTLEGLSNLDSIGGSLIIDAGIMLASLTGLENLQVIGGDLSVTTLAMTDFTGLDNLHSIGGSIIHSFANYTGLESLTTIGGDFPVVSDMDNFQGLNNLTSIGGSFHLGEDHYDLTDFSGLENLTTIGGNLSITGDENYIGGLNGLGGVTTIGGDFRLTECGFSDSSSILENLSTVGGSILMSCSFDGELPFTNLSTIGGGIYVDAGVHSLTGLENLTNFGNGQASSGWWSLSPGEIRLKNSGLTDISAISHLTIDTLTIINNPNLSVCGIESVCEYLAQGGVATISDNAGGCDTVGDILQVCTAQCPPEDVILLSQQDVNEYAALYPNCTEFYGDLIIGTEGVASPSDIVDLTSFSNMTAIAGNLVIGKNDPLMTLEGLSNIDTIGGNLIVEQSTLTGFTGLAGLSSIGGNFSVTEYTFSFAGLENLKTIHGDFRLDQCEFSNFQGLNDLNTIHGDFYLNQCTAPNFQGLDILSIIHGGFIFGEGNTFDDFTGLEELGFIAGGFQLPENNNIGSLSGLSKLTVVGSMLISNVNNTDLTDLESLSNTGSIRIQSCEMMTSLTGLENTSASRIHLNDNQILADISAVSHMTLNELVIQGNNSLSVCDIESICNYLAQGNTATIEDNAEGCDTVQEVWQGCGIECPPGDVVLLSQEEVNTFGMFYPDCTELPGNLQIGTIGGSTIPSTDITDLSPLNNIITIIAGDLIIGKNDSSMTLAGLSGLSSLGNSLIIEGGSTIASLEGLENLTVINGDLDNRGTVQLVNFVGLENLNTIEGSLIIDGDVEFENFIGLENLSSIGGDLFLGDETEFENFTGLESLTTIGGDLFFDEDAELQSFIGLEVLTTIGGNLFIGEDVWVENFIGLESLITIGGNLATDGDARLGSFSGLESLTHIGGNLHIHPDDTVSLDGLENLITIEGNMYIGTTHISTPDLSSFENLSTIGGGLYINSLNIESLNGLESVTNFGNFPVVPNVYDIVPGEIRLARNDELTDVSAISQWAIDTLTITENGSLALCGIASICEYLVQGGIATIEDNAEGCNTVEEIIQSCTPLLEYTIQGNVFADNNADCIQDADEPDLDDWLIKIEEDNQLPRYAYTFGGGNYIALADSGAQYTLTAIPPNMLWNNICPMSDVVSISEDNPHNGIAFGATGSALCPLLEVDITSPIVRRCFDSSYYVRYCNSGTAVAENAYVEVQLDPFFTYQNATIEGIDLGENLYSFDLGNIDVAECGSFRIDVYVDCDSTVLGQTHCMEAHIFPDSICTPALPTWDGASIIVDAQCLGDSIEFRIENVGMGDMSDSLEYIVVEEDLIWQRTNFQLDSGQHEKFYKQANGEFHRLEAEQSPGHPGNSMPSVFVEGCGENDNGEISVGFVNYYLLDEGDAFVSIDCQQNVGSYDPNDKQAFPVGYGAPHYITDSTNLEYMIRFQNTGTDTAFNIVIHDAISPHLNIETLRPGVASHPYRYDIEGSNTAVFHFENIMLPDSNVNEAASHGFIKFNIKQKQNNPIGTHIMNDAAIYFDFNEPIITNTVYHTVSRDFMGIVTSVIMPQEVEEAGISVNVFPNPFDEYTRFEVQGEAVSALHLSVYDMTGREVFQQKAQHQQYITMKRNNLPPGVYIFRLMDERQQLATGKLVIK